jgi:hypothetical protein
MLYTLSLILNIHFVRHIFYYQKVERLILFHILNLYANNDDDVDVWANRPNRPDAFIIIIAGDPLFCKSERVNFLLLNMHLVWVHEYSILMGFQIPVAVKSETMAMTTRGKFTAAQVGIKVEQNLICKSFFFFCLTKVTFFFFEN